MARITQQSGCGWEVKRLKKRWADYHLYLQWMGMCVFLKTWPNYICNKATVNSNDV